MSEEPRLSKDGKFYWDGQRWVPLPGEAQREVVVTKQPRGAWNSCVGYGCLLVALIFVVAALGAVCSGKH